MSEAELERVVELFTRTDQSGTAGALFRSVASVRDGDREGVCVTVICAICRFAFYLIAESHRRADFLPYVCASCATRTAR